MNQNAPAPRRTPAMTPTEFNAGMVRLSGALDHYRPITDQQSAARSEAYYEELQYVPLDVWEAAVTAELRARKPQPDRTGTALYPPLFPSVGELLDTCSALLAERTLRLPAPQVTPAPPEVARAAIARIKSTLRTARGPLGGALGKRTDARFAPPPPRDPADAPAPRPPLRVIPGGRR